MARRLRGSGPGSPDAGAGVLPSRETLRAFIAAAPGRLGKR